MEREMLDREVLCIMDIRQIQTYIFRVNSQEAVRGGENMVKRILTDALAWAVEQIDPPLPADRVDLSNRPTEGPIPWFADPCIQVQMINAVAGNALLLFRTGELCRKVLHKVSRYVLEHSYGLDFAAAAVEKTHSLENDINRLYDRLDRCKTDFPTSHPLPPLPAVLVEPNTGEPAVMIREDGTPVSRSEMIRRKGVLGELSLADIHTGIGPDGRACRAVMHLDGNNMGIMIGKILSTARDYETGIRMRRIIDFNIRDGFKTLVQDSVDWLRQRCFPNGISDEEFNRFFYIVDLGGDDLNVMAQPNLILPFVERFMQLLPNYYIWKDEQIQAGITVCAGIAFVSPETGYLPGYDVAEACCANAKKTAKKKENLIDGLAGNWIDFDVQLGPDPQSLEWKRGHMGVTREGIRLMIRPYSFDEKQAGTPRDYRLLKARAKALNDMNISERGIQLLERACSMGAVDFDALVQTFEKSGCQLTGQLGDPWIRIGKMRCNAWYDIVMISPFFRDYEDARQQPDETAPSGMREVY